nr:uncharacterized protein LOC118682787 [Bactrocera oleae]
MTTICRYCNALKFERETAGLCCASEKDKLNSLLTPPQPLKPLFDGSDPDSSHFLQHILEYNNCFRMTSFGANIIREGGFMPTCKIQGQMYHLHGSMVPTPDEPHQFLQIYFISPMVDQLNERCYIQGTQQLKRRIIEKLQAFFHANNAVVNMFKTALERMPSDTHKFVIRADCTPTSKHVRRFNAPTVNDVAAIIVGRQFQVDLASNSRGTPADELNACLKASPLWNNVKILSLTTNMRVQLQNGQNAAQFSKQLLVVGNGKVPVDATSGLMALTNDFCRFVDSQLALIENVFPNTSENYQNYAWLSQRAILATNLVTYKFVDSITNPDDVVNYPTEFLNSLELPGFPPHNLQLKVGTVIMILRNLNPPRLCNGTRLSVKRLLPNLIEATIINGKYAGENVYIPRTPMIPTDLPFDFKRLQFSVRLAFATTINESQGQSLSVCGINLENHCFSHGQLYVTCSRVGKPSALFVLTSDQKTKNVVYQRALQ